MGRPGRAGAGAGGVSVLRHAVAAPGCEGRERRADLSSLFRGAVVEGRAIVPGGRSVRRKCGDLFPGQRRSLVHLADGVVGRGPIGQGRTGPVPGPGRAGGVWVRACARGGPTRPAWSRPAGSLARRRCCSSRSSPTSTRSSWRAISWPPTSFSRLREVRETSPTLVLAALAAGGALGTKAVGVVFIPPLLALAIVGILVQTSPARTKLVRIARDRARSACYPEASGSFATRCSPEIRSIHSRSDCGAIPSGTAGTGPKRCATSPYYCRLRIGGLWAISCSRCSIPGWRRFGSPRWPGPGRSRTRRQRRAGLDRDLLADGDAERRALLGLIPYRTQQRFMLQALGLAVVPLAMTLDRSAGSDIWRRFCSGSTC